MLLLFFHRQVIWQSNHSNVPVQQVIEIPPEFDPDSSEFVSDISDYTTEFKKEEILHIPFEFDLDRADLAPDIEHHSIELQREQMEIPLDFDPDSAELSPDITEYTTKLKQVWLLLCQVCCASNSVQSTVITFYCFDYSHMNVLESYGQI